MDTQAYRVAVLLTINDQLSKQLEKVSKDAAALDGKFGSINKNIQSITRSATAAAKALERMNSALTGKLAIQARNASDYARSMQKAAESAVTANKAMSGLGGAGAGGLVALAAANSVSSRRMLPAPSYGGALPPALPPSSGLMGLPPPSNLPAVVPEFERGFFGRGGGGSGVPPTGPDADFPGNYGGGAAPKRNRKEHGMENLAIAYAGFEFMKSAVDAGAKYQTVTEKFRQFGLGDQALKEAEKFAQSTQIMGSSTTDMLRYFTEAQGVFRESGAATIDEQLKGARLAAPIMAKMQLAMRGLDEHAREMTAAKQMDMLRFVEQAGGLQDATKFNRLMDMGFKAIQSSGGNIDFTQMRQFMAKAGTAAFGLSEKALFAELEPVIGELKGSSAGDALMTSYNRLNGIIKLPNQVVHDLEKMGIWNSKLIEHNKMGGVKKFNGNPLINSELFAQSPVEYYEKMILPIYRSRKMSETEIQRTNALIFGRTGGKMFNLIDKQLQVIHHSVESFNKARGLNASYNAVGGTYAGKQVDFEAKWENFQLALAQDGGLLDMFTSGLTKLTIFLKDATRFSNEHPQITSAGTSLLALTTAISGVKGVTWLLKSAFSALFSPINFLTGSKGISLLNVGLDGFVGVLGRIIPLLALFIPTNNTPNTTQELAERSRLEKENLKKRDPLAQYAGSWQGQVADWVKNHPGQPIPNFRTDQNGKMYPEPRNPLKTIQVHSTINLDGRKVGDAVTDHIVKNSSRAPTGPSGVDSTMNLIHAGMNSLVTR